MKILLDTNIIIHRETSDIQNEDIGTLFSWFDRLHYEKCIHPLTIEEIEKHKDRKIVNAFKVKMNSYILLKTQAPFSPQINDISKKFDSSSNDINDTRLINELFSNRVDFLVTEDKKIHDKAKAIGMDSKVFTIESFIEKVTSENPSLVDYKTLAVRKELFGNVDLVDTFFDSFRTDYVGFDSWFNKKSDETCYVCKETEKI